uniref:phytanoyl-CoA dioxygenase family protein n=1 Tax=Roseivirga sp. TaxID=1964215 RepID=UPI004048B586
MKSYGIDKIEINNSKIDSHIENLSRMGYSREENIFQSHDCENFIRMIYDVYAKQENDFGRENLKLINELNMCRMPFLTDTRLALLFSNQLILSVVERYLGTVYQLHLQNAIINKGQEEHHQSSWHRDLPYQNWVISKPLAVNAFIYLTDFTVENGATQIIPYSHLFDNFPSQEFSEKNFIPLTGKKGDVIFFDSMCFHRAGFNSTGNDRIGVNNMYTVPILKPQVDVGSDTGYINNLDDVSRKVLGLSYSIPNSVLDFRQNRIDRL